MKMVLRVTPDGRLNIESDVHDMEFALEMLTQAIDAVKAHHYGISPPQKIIVPSYDTDFEKKMEQEQAAKDKIVARVK